MYQNSNLYKASYNTDSAEAAMVLKNKIVLQ